MYGIEIRLIRSCQGFRFSHTVLVWSPMLQLLRIQYDDSQVVTIIEYVQKQLEVK